MNRMVAWRKSIAGPVVAAIVAGVPCGAVGIDRESKTTALEAGGSPGPAAIFGDAALARAIHVLPREQPVVANTCASNGASVVEKLAWLYLAVSGAIFLAYGPQEKTDNVWTDDGKSETVAGATALVLSFGLLHDILKRRHPPTHCSPS